MVRRALRVRRNMAVAWLGGGLIAASLVAPAVAQNEPLLVMRGHPGAPVLLYGVDISGAVIEGEFGLNRPGQVAPTIIMPFWRIYRFYAVAPAGYFPSIPGYFPSIGRGPRYGRLAVIPPPFGRLPTPAAPFYREWESSPVLPPVPHEPPPVIVAPRLLPPLRRPPSRPLTGP